MEFEVLRDGSDYGTGENCAVFANSRAVEDCDVTSDLCPFTDLDVAVDGSERSDDNVLANLGFRMDISQGLVH